MKYSYEEVIEIIQNTRRFGNYTGYEVSKHMLEQLGNPQSGIPFVHIAGTNGKGSTTAFLCKILEQTGKKIGMFTSPHLVDFEERIRINGVFISKEDVTRLGNQLLAMEFELSPTMFDYCLAMAVLYFKEQQCDLMVMETGIGGRFDSTNALGVPEASIITKIGFDHMTILGNTLEEIAGEKSGIIKQGCPVVIAPQQESVRKVLLEEFRCVNQLDETVNFTHVDLMREDIYLTQEKIHIYEVTEENRRFVSDIPMKMQGSFQLENAAMAALTARVILAKWEISGHNNLPLDKDAIIRTGITDTWWKGRMELVNEKPFFMIDGAHNSHGVHALASGLVELYPEEKFHFIMAVMADKDYEEMIEELLPLAIDFVTVTPESNRALQAKDLAECIRKKGIKATYSDDMESVIGPLLSKKSNGHASKEAHHKTVAFGSLYFIGAIEKLRQEYSIRE